MTSQDSIVKTMIAEKIIQADFKRFVKDDLKVKKLVLDADAVFVLYALDLFIKFNQKELSGILDIDPATIGRMIERLEKEKFIAKTKSASDGRKNDISITEKGKDALAQLNKTFAKWYNGTIVPISMNIDESMPINKRIQEIAHYIIINKWGEI